MANRLVHRVGFGPEHPAHPTPGPGRGLAARAPRLAGEIARANRRHDAARHAAGGPAILYPMALVKDSKDPAAARKFLDYLDSPEATRVFEKFGFLIPK